jgi:enterochelin esterase-like enzyme
MTTATHPLLERAHRDGTPLIDGDTVTFLWQGDDPPYLKADFNQWGLGEALPLSPERVAEGLWQYEVRLPDTAYMEYAFFRDPARDDNRRPDPFNPRRLFNGAGQYNHYFDMPSARHTALLRYRPNTPRGTVTHHTLTVNELVVGKRRDLWLYQPPVQAPVPLVLVYDGRGYYRRAKLNIIVDNLIAQHRIAPIALAFVDDARAHRFVEYHTSEAMLFTVAAIYQVARQHLSLLDPEMNPGAFGVIGASLGGLMALFTAMRMPHYVGKVIMQAGAFDIAPTPGTEPLIRHLLRLLPPQPLCIWQDVGSFDWLLEGNRSMKALLEEKGYDLTYREYAGGHNFTAWRNALPDALVTLFPPV